MPKFLVNSATTIEFLGEFRYDAGDFMQFQDSGNWRQYGKLQLRKTGNFDTPEFIFG